jgi:hypothetical protein
MVQWKIDSRRHFAELFGVAKTQLDLPRFAHLGLLRVYRVPRGGRAVSATRNADDASKRTARAGHYRGETEKGHPVCADRGRHHFHLITPRIAWRGSRGIMSPRSSRTSLRPTADVMMVHPITSRIACVVVARSRRTRPKEVIPPAPDRDVTMVHPITSRIVCVVVREERSLPLECCSSRMLRATPPSGPGTDATVWFHPITHRSPAW